MHTMQLKCSSYIFWLTQYSIVNTKFTMVLQWVHCNTNVTYHCNLLPIMQLKCSIYVICLTQFTMDFFHLHHLQKVSCWWPDLPGCSFISHVKSIHEWVRYPCDQCDYKATQNSNLVEHIKSINYRVQCPCN